MFELLSGSAFIVVYYLFKLFSLEAALFISWQQWGRHTSFKARRLIIAFVGLTVFQLVLLLVLALTSGGPFGAPFERVTHIASMGVLVWAFAPYFRQNELTGNILLGVNTGVALLSYLVVIVFGTADGFNQSVADIVLGMWAIGLVSFGIINCVTSLDDERLYALFSFSLFAFGGIAHLLLADSYPPTIDTPLLVRLGEMIAYPLLTVAIYLGALQSLAARTREFEKLSEISLDQIKGLIAMFEATKQIAASLKLAEVLDGAAKSICVAMNADECAIALPTDAADQSQLRLSGIYNPTRQGRGEAVSFPIHGQPPIQYAIRSQSHVLVDNYRDNPTLEYLFTLMGAQSAGPMLVQPLVRGEQTLGVILLGNSRSERMFSEIEIELSRSLGEQVAVSIQHAKDYEALSAKAQQLSWTLRNQELETGKRRAALESTLKKSREEAQILSKRLYDEENASKRKDGRLEELQKQINTLEAKLRHARQAVEQSDEQLAMLSQNSEALDRYKLELSRLEKELSQTKAELENAQSEGRKLGHALKRAKQQATNQPVSEEQQEREVFMASLAQDLRTPMTSITGYTDLLLNESVGELSVMQSRFLQRVRANIERLNSLVSDLVGITTLDSGQLALSLTVFELTEAIEDSLIEVRAQLEEKEMTVSQQIDEELPFVEADRDSISQVLNNLLENGIKASPIQSQLVVTARRYGEPTERAPAGYIQITVRDAGGGIAPTDLPRVFERIYRADTPLIQGLGETGVGLSIAKALVEANHGQIWVESDIGEGATFFVTLPASTQGDDPWSQFLGTLPPLDLTPPDDDLP